jgi:hypothetical protein
MSAPGGFSVSPIKKQEESDGNCATPDRGRARRAAARRSDAARQRFVHRIRRQGDAADSDDSSGTAPAARTPIRQRPLALRPTAHAAHISCCSMEWGNKVSRTRVTRPRKDGLSFTTADALYVAPLLFC